MCDSFKVNYPDLPLKGLKVSDSCLSEFIVSPGFVFRVVRKGSSGPWRQTIVQKVAPHQAMGSGGGSGSTTPLVPKDQPAAAAAAGGGEVLRGSSGASEEGGAGGGMETGPWAEVRSKHASVQTNK